MRAIGIVRQSRGRDESLSPAEQRERIESVCEREGLELTAVHEEIDVSGGTPLAERKGLRAAVESIEGKEAQVVVVAYFDRLFRSLVVQAEVVKRVEEAGGRILAADIGEVSASTPAQWISGTMLGVVSEYYRRSVRERAGAGQALAVERGHLPYPKVPVGYVRGEDGVLVPDTVEGAAAILRAFQLRGEGATIREVRAFLAHSGIVKSYPGVQAMLRSRVYRGEIHFGKLVNLHAHEAIVDETTWRAAQAVRGRPKGTQRLLSRLRILRCASCDSPLWLNVQRTYSVYRCGHPDCSKRVSITATLVEDFIVEAVRDRNREMVGQAAVEDDASRAEGFAARAQADLDAAIAAFAGLETEAAAIQKIRELRDRRDDAVAEAGHLRSRSRVLEVSMDDWDRFTEVERRAIIRDTVDVAVVAPGRGLERVKLKFLPQ